MRCAMELQMTAMVKAEERARAEAARKMKAAAIIKAATIRKCEELGAQLEALADSGYRPYTSFYLTWNRVLETTNKDYADHRLSYNVTSEEINLSVMREWFAQWCFKVTEHETYGWIYGAGEVPILRISIEPDAQCLK